MRVTAAAATAVRCSRVRDVCPGVRQKDSNTGRRSIGIEAPAIQDCLPEVTVPRNHRWQLRFEGQESNGVALFRI